MFNKIIAFSVNNKLIVGLFIVGLILFGIYQVGHLPIDAVPDITDNQVQVITRTPSLGAPDVERLISFPVEQSCRNIPSVKNIRSFSRFGLSVVTIVFDDKVDVYWARQQVSERLGTIASQIPIEFGKPEMAPLTTGLGEIYQYSVRALPGYENKYGPMELRTIQDWTVRKQLLGLPGVADVSSLGGYLKQYEIAINAYNLQANGLTIADVFNALQKNNSNTGGAYIEHGPVALFIRSEGLVGSLDDIGTIVVKNLSNGTPVRIRDVADVRLGYATRYGAMTWNGKQQVAGAVVMMLKGANSNEVIKSIKQRVNKIQKTLPKGVVIDAFLDRTKMVNNAIKTVEHNLIEGILIVMFVLILFLGNVRAGLLVASVIPLAMLIAVIFMNLFKVSGNLMSLGALDFGLIVDGTVIIVEAIMHEVHAKKENEITPEAMNEEVITVSARMRNTAVFGELIILIVYIPIFTLQGIEGKMFQPMAQTVAFSLIGAFILSLTYVPVMGSIFLSRKSKNTMGWSDRMINHLQKGYHALLERVIVHPKTILVIGSVSFIIAVFVLTRLGGEFIPKLDEGDFAVDTRVLTGSSLQTSIKAISEGSRILLKKFPEVEQVVSKTGSSEIPTDPMPLDASDMMVILKDKSQWTSAKSFSEITDKMTKELQAVAGVTFGFQYPVQMRFNELMTGSRQDVVCKIFGENLESLAQLAKKTGAIAGGIKGVRDIYVETITGMPQIVIRYNRESLATYGVNIDDVNKVINTAFAGQSSGTVYEGEKRFDLVVRLAGDSRKQLGDVQNVRITARGGLQIPLRELATVDIEDGPNQIQREDGERRIIIGFNVSGGDVQGIVEELQKKVANQVKFPTGYYVTYGGAFENLNAAKKRLTVAVPVSLILILLLLYFAFRSVKEGLMIFSAVPLSAIGGVLALVIRGMPFSISAGVGFIALFGVAVLNGLVLISEFNRLRKEGWEDVKAIVFEGTKLRLRPVLMTASVASLGFLPMALSNGSGAEVQRPLATVVIGGLITATLLTLFVLPALYLLFQKIKPLKVSGNAVSVILALSSVMFMQNAKAQIKAQTYIDLTSAIDTAMKNNLTLRGEQLNASYLKQNISTSITLPRTNLAGEYGYVNSASKDTRFSVLQTVNFPTAYVRQKALLNAEYQSGKVNVVLQARSLQRLVSESFYQIVYLTKKRQLLLGTDSIYSLFFKSTLLRFQKGESNVLEKTTAETQQGQIGIQIEQVNTDLAIEKERFDRLLNASHSFVPDPESRNLPFPIVTDTAWNAYPQIRFLGAQQQIARAQTRIEQSMRLPDLGFGYINQTFTGSLYQKGAGQFYDNKHRFSSFEITASIPLFLSGQRFKIKALRILEQKARVDYQAGVINFKNLHDQLLKQMLKYRNLAAYYETKGLPNAAQIIKTANLQFAGGEIGYLDYVLLINQAISVRSEYIDAVNNLNQVVIQFNTL